METSGLHNEFNTDYTFKDYLLVINPSLSFDSSKGSASKNVRLVGKADKLWQQPHISLCRFIMADYLEDAIKQELSDFLQKNDHIKAVGHSFESRMVKRPVIHPEKEKVKKMQRDMMAILKKRVRLVRAFSRRFQQPHLTVGLAYSQRQFQKTLARFDKLSTNSGYFLEEITVLSRPYSHNSNLRWQKLFALPLGT